MKYILIASLLSCAAYAAPFAAQQGANGNGQAAQQQQGQQQGGRQQGQQQQGAKGAQTGTGAGVGDGQTPSTADLATAVANWMADTSMVSDFLNRGPGIQNNVAFKQAATVAFNAEVDELNHKAVIDAANGADPNVIAANSTLATGGSFQDVVDKLKLMSVQGRAAVANIDLINQNRCVNVLPNIDAYMASTGSASQAVRPKVCDQTGVTGVVQGNGPTLPGDQPGTPAKAIAAAKAGANGQQQAGQGQQQAGQGQQAAQGGQQQAAQGQQGTTPALQAAQQGQQASGAAASPNANQAAGNAAQQQQGQAASAQQGQAASAQQGQATEAKGQASQAQAGGAAKGQKGGAAGKAAQ